jgi:3-hydroxyisobutyrate dehydrogenase-like beta-hydroxyacid dehydrogenase
LILKTAADEQLPMPATEAAYRINSDEQDNGDERDFSAVLRRMEEIAGVHAA